MYHIADTSITIAVCNFSLIYYNVYLPNALFLGVGPLLSWGRGSFLELSAAGHAEARVCTRRKIWARPGSGACSGRSKSRDLASNRGVAFARVRASQDNGKPTQHKKEPVATGLRTFSAV